MTRILFVLFFPTLLITSYPLSPVLCSTDSPFANSPISLQANNKPINEILKDIEKQTKYTITIQNCNTLNDKKSIAFSQTPLDLALKRLFRNQNYSTVYDDARKTLLLKILNQKDFSTGRKNTKKQHNTTILKTVIADSMREATEAFQEYKNTDPEPKPIPLAQAQDSPMDAVTEAFQELNNDESEQPVLKEPAKSSPMDQITIAFQEHDNNKDNPTLPEAETKVVETNSSPMNKVTNAFIEYDSNKIKQAAPAPVVQKTDSPNDAISDAFQRYKQGHWK